MEINLSSKTALVTGGAGGIGRACVRALAQAGARVAVADINLPGAQEAVAPYAGGLALRCDLGDPQNISALCRNLLEQSGVVDIIVNCAGIVSFKRGIQSLTAEEWDLVLNVNLRAPFLICRELVEPMKARRSGKIINFSSMAGRAGGLEAGLHYSVSKAGLIGLTKSLAKELGPYGICVNAVAPGFTETEAVKQQLRGKADRYIAQIPLGRLGQPADVAEVVLFLASPMSDYLTGLVIDINGGMYTG